MKIQPCRLRLPLGKTCHAGALALAFCSTSAQANMGNMNVFGLLIYLFGPVIGLMMLPPLVFIGMRGRIPKLKWFAILLATWLAGAGLAWLAGMGMLASHGMWIMLPWFMMPLPGWFVAVMYERAVRRALSDATLD